MKARSSGIERGDCRFPRKEKLKGRDDIKDVFNRGRGVSSAGARLIRLPNGLPHNRIAFTFPRKFGNAVKRNRTRRLCREIYRHMRSDLLVGFDLVLLLYPEKNHDHAAAHMPKSRRDRFLARSGELRGLFLRSGLLDSSSDQELT